MGEERATVTDSSPALRIVTTKMVAIPSPIATSSGAWCQGTCR